MVNTAIKQIKLHLDKVERRKIAEIKAMKPEYSDLKLYQVAHMELKERLFEEVRRIKEIKESPCPWIQSDNMAVAVSA